MAIKIAILYMGFLTWLFNNKNESGTTKSIADANLSSETDSNWADIKLEITSTVIKNGIHIFTCKGNYKDKLIGLKIEIKSTMNAGITEAGTLTNDGFINDAVQIKSIGLESDNFINVLSQLYGMSTTKLFTKETELLTIFSLNQTPVNLTKPGSYKLKLFFDHDEEEYAELYLNINTGTSSLELAEKDIEYRKNLITILTK
jgi:hypothetical protein